MKKTSVLALLEILKENSDENHLLSLSEILSLMKERFDLDLDRRTIYNNVEMLQSFGYDIETYDENNKGYCLREREFETSEVYLLCNAIHSSNMVPEKASKDLIEKLLNTQSKYVKDSFHKNVYVRNEKKKENKQFFFNIELLSDCIKNKKAISFYYTKYNLNKEIVNRREEKYELSPYYLVYANEKTYLIGKSFHHDGLTHFRIDKMKDIEIILKNFTKADKTQDPYEYAKTKVYMFSGEGKDIEILCDISILDDIIDRFGSNIILIKEDENHFKAHIKGNEEGMKYFALQYIDHLQVIEPASLKKSIQESLKEGIKKYA